MDFNVLIAMKTTEMSEKDKESHLSKRLNKVLETRLENDQVSTNQIKY